MSWRYGGDGKVRRVVVFHNEMRQQKNLFMIEGDTMS